MAFLMKPLVLLMIFECRKVKSQQNQFAVKGSTVQIRCPYDGRNNNYISWYTQNKQLSFETTIYNKVTDLTPRLNITGNHGAGEYHLSIFDVRKTDEGQYDCKQTTPPTTSVQYFVVIESLTNIIISNKVSNKVQGTEDQDLTINCTAVGGNPAPELTLYIGTDVYKVNRTYTIVYLIRNVSRSYDGVTVTCKTGYYGIPYTPLTDATSIDLYLKPLKPTFSMNPIVTQNTKSLVLTCASTGSRPAPTEWIWMIGNSSINITSNSTFPSPSLQADGTYTVISTLTYKVSKMYNQQNIKCGFKNTATGGEHVSYSSRMDVQYALVASVQNKTFTLTQTSRVISCDVDGNPISTYFRWHHKSKYGTLIRVLDGNSTLVLPPQTEENRYQDTGEYVCTVSNGIPDEDGNLNQRGSGYIISTAPPRLLEGDSQVHFGQFGKNVDINVSVYSDPKYYTPIWLKDGSALPRSSKYITEEVYVNIKDIFHGTEVQVDGHRLTLSIHSLEKNDFVNYTLRLNNGVGQTVEHIIVLMSASAPETPANFSVSDETESTVTLHWVPGFDGGHTQRFVIQYRSGGSQAWQETGIPDLIQFTDDGLHSFTLPGLQDGTSYEIRLYAENKFNKSLPTDIEKIFTKGSTLVMSIAIAVGVSIVVVIGIVIAGFFIYRIKLGRQKQSSAANSSGNENNGADYYNIDNHVSDTSSQRENHYEKMTPKGGECDNVYTDLDSQNGDNNRKSGAYNNYINIDRRNRQSERQRINESAVINN